MACPWCSVCWSFEMSSRDLHTEVGWDASQSFASPVTQKAAARCGWLGSPGSQATSFCCNCSCFPRSAPRELSLPRTSWSSSADQKDFPHPSVSRCPGCLLPHGKKQTCKGHPALGQLSLDCWALLVIGLLGLLLISEIFVEILQWMCPIVVQNISLPSSSNSKGLTWGVSPRLISWAL